MSKNNSKKIIFLIFIIILFIGCTYPQNKEIKENFYNSHKDSKIISISRGEGDFDNVYIHVKYISSNNKKDIKEAIYLYQNINNQ